VINITKNLLHFRCRKYRCILHNPRRKLPNYASPTVRAITPFKVIQGHRVCYQRKSHMRLPSY